MRSHFSYIEPNLKWVFLQNLRLFSLWDKTLKRIKDLFFFFLLFMFYKIYSFELVFIKLKKWIILLNWYFLNRYEECLDYNSLFQMHECNLRRFSSVLKTKTCFYLEKSQKTQKTHFREGFFTFGVFLVLWVGFFGLDFLC